MWESSVRRVAEMERNIDKPREAGTEMGVSTRLKYWVSLSKKGVQSYASLLEC
jgi:hypothetical protein